MSGDQHLVLPLVPLPAQARVLRLDDRLPWAEQVATADEACLLLDTAGRVVAMSVAAAAVLAVDPRPCGGARGADLPRVIDFTVWGSRGPDAASVLPPLRSLATGRLTRGLVRLRLPVGTTPTLDLVGVPVTDGALAFLCEV